jgi:hypothetical protein
VSDKDSALRARTRSGRVSRAFFGFDPPKTPKPVFRSSMMASRRAVWVQRHHEGLAVSDRGEDQRRVYPADASIA